MTRTVSILAVLLAALLFVASQGLGAVLSTPGYMRPDVPEMGWATEEPKFPSTCVVERPAEILDIQERPDEPELAFRSGGMYEYPKSFGSTCLGGGMAEEEVPRLDIPEIFEYER